MHFVVLFTQVCLLFSTLCVSDPFRAHNERMHQMIRGFSDPFNHGFMPSITDGRDRGRRGEGQARTSVALQNEHRVSTES